VEIFQMMMPLLLLLLLLVVVVLFSARMDSEYGESIHVIKQPEIKTKHKTPTKQASLGSHTTRTERVWNQGRQNQQPMGLVPSSRST
jgi:hypothetical protein